MDLPNGLPFPGQETAPGMGCVGPWPRRAGAVGHKPRTPRAGRLGCVGPWPRRTGAVGHNPRTLPPAGQARSSVSDHERGLDHQAARRTCRTAGVFSQDRSSHHAATVTLFRPPPPTGLSGSRQVSAEAGRPSSPSRGGRRRGRRRRRGRPGRFGCGRRPAASAGRVLCRRPRRRTRCRPARPGSGRPQALLIRISRTEPSSHNSVIP
jgi:hypothetical protein